MGVSGNWGTAPTIAIEILQKLAKLRGYCEIVGWELEEFHVGKEDVIDDARIGLLKIASVGDVVDGIGMRVSDEEFYVVRKPAF